jgi:hypothetical protein
MWEIEHWFSIVRFCPSLLVHMPHIGGKYRLQIIVFRGYRGSAIKNWP